jgi:hypothetical protein
VSSNGRMIDELERNRPWRTPGTISSFGCRDCVKSGKRQDNRFAGRESNRTVPERKSAALTAAPHWYVSGVNDRLLINIVSGLLLILEECIVYCFIGRIVGVPLCTLQYAGPC